MKLIGLIGFLLAPLLPAIGARAGSLSSASQVGDTYEITFAKDSARQGSHGSSGSSHDKDTIIERVIGLRAEGLELLYDLPSGATADEKATEWQFPAQIYKPFTGPGQLINATELEGRVDVWLKFAKLPRSACGHWIFTWYAFRIECDPQSVINIIQSYDLRSVDLREGASYQEVDALGSGKLARIAVVPECATLTVELPVDPDAVRRARAESDVAMGEIMRNPLSLDAALAKRAKETISGTISVTFEMDSAGNARRRVKVTKLDISAPNGPSETQTVTETLERRLISRRE